MSSLKPGWKMVKFGEVVKNANLVERDPEANDIERIVGLEHIDPENLHIRRWNSVADSTSFTRKFVPGQTLFGKRRAYQRKVAYAEFEGICSGDILTFEPKNRKVLLPELLPFICQSDAFFDHALDTSAGSLSPRTSWTALQGFEFPLPPLDEQKRIAEILWAVDESLQARRKAHEDLQISIQAARNELFFAAFDDGVPEQRNFFSVKHKNGWTVKKLSDVTHKIVDGVHKTPKYTKTGVPFLTVENLTAGPGIDFGSTRFISESDHREFIKRTNPEQGDVLVSKDGTLGVPRLVDTDREFSIFVSVALLKPKHEVIRSQLLCHYIESSVFRKHVLMHTSGSALKHIHLIDFKSAPLPFATDLKEQDRLLSNINSLTTADLALRKAISDEQEMARAILANSLIGATHV